MDGFTILSYEFNYRGLSFSFFVLGLLLFGFIEHTFPFKIRKVSQVLRWTHNLSLVGLNNVFMKLLVPLSLLSALSLSESYNVGLLKWIDGPYYIKFFLSLILLDLTIYWQHRLFHKIPFLWKLHSVHHADLDFDTTTGIRFHTLEIVLSFAIKWVFVFIFAPPLLAIFVFEIVLNLSSMFNHMNVLLPEKMDKLIRKGIVTPNMHRIHHSIEVKEQNKNFGFNLSIWDHLFKSYLEKSRFQENIPIGLSYAQDEKMTVRILDLLKFPFLNFKSSKTNEK
jgi:sterol desaturase/sphingolipid hydroxylase (fatty acid hydroxylase superfamily)